MDLSLAENVCLALIEEGINHGWAIGTELAPDGEIGRIWSLSRPLTYRALEQLEVKRLVRRSSAQGTLGGRGRDRVLLSCTPAGRRVSTQWMAAPVEHLRQVRTELLMKLVLRRRRGLDLAPLITAQQTAFREHFDILTTARPDAEVVDLWRRESARSVRRFLDLALGQLTEHEPIPDRPLMRLSARNQLSARVVDVSNGEVMSTVKTVLPDGQRITAIITRESVVDLDIAPDDEVLVVVKSTEVMLAKP